MIDGSRRGFFLVYVKERTERPGNIEIGVIGSVEARDRTIGWSCPITLCSRGVVSGDLRLVGLVEVAEAEKFSSTSAHVTHFEDGAASQLLLHVEVEILRVGSANVRINT